MAGSIYPVAVAWGSAGDEETCGCCASIEGLVLLAGRDFESFAGLEQKIVVFDFESEFSFEHVEELTSVNVGVANLARAWWHEFFDHAQFGSLDEMPAVAVGGLRPSPFVVFGGFCADDLGRQIEVFP